MLFTRQQLEEIEDKSLAPYGMRSQNSKGRAYLDSEPDYRTSFQRDRDRIIHTTAFRRLEHKTQVFITYEGDYYRTRLTHTLEVAQIGRTIARTLGGNEDLIEIIRKYGLAGAMIATGGAGALGAQTGQAQAGY